jgi:hypothetical protein
MLVSDWEPDPIRAPFEAVAISLVRNGVFPATFGHCSARHPLSVT